MQYQPNLNEEHTTASAVFCSPADLQWHLADDAEGISKKNKEAIFKDCRNSLVRLATAILAKLQGNEARLTERIELSTLVGQMM